MGRGQGVESDRPVKELEGTLIIQVKDNDGLD